ncbi:amidase signature enzyme [Melanogaster broomeanus]|nr:amidase signature enzyme [Melanogaster broomeanus]
MPSWSQLAADKKQRQQKEIPQDWLITPPPEATLNVTGFPETYGLLTPQEIEITNTDVDVLLKKLASAEWSSVAVTTAFYKRAIIAQQLVNCLTEIFVERALARAAELDEALKKTGKVVETTMGYVSWIGNYAEKNAVLVDILEECGAVPFVRTNVPQTLMWPETFNNIFGRTTNSVQSFADPGGSSGGEGALLALKGSPLGVGSDIGGSVRIPAALWWLQYLGLKAFMEAVIKAKPWLKDPLAVRKKWDEDEYQLKDRDDGRKLCFAIMNAQYTTVWNALDYPASVFPVTTVDQTLDLKKARESFVDGFDQMNHELYDPEVFKNAPVCLQLVGRTLEEEAVIAMTEIVDAALKAVKA